MRGGERKRMRELIFKYNFELDTLYNISLAIPKRKVKRNRKEERKTARYRAR